MESPQYDVFLSYASDDSEWASKLNQDLEKRGIKTFFAPRDIEPGTKFPPSLVDAIENSRTFAVIVSPKSMESAWVEDECGRAQSRANARKDPKRIIPILYQPAPLRDFLGERQAIDFTQPADYQESLDRLTFVIRPRHLGVGRPGDGVWIEYPHKELRGYSEDFCRILRYLLD